MPVFRTLTLPFAHAPCMPVLNTCLSHCDCNHEHWQYKYRLSIYETLQQLLTTATVSKKWRHFLWHNYMTSLFLQMVVSVQCAWYLNTLYLPLALSTLCLLKMAIHLVLVPKLTCFSAPWNAAILACDVTHNARKHKAFALLMPTHFYRHVPHV